jgi:hypothetical protein
LLCLTAKKFNEPTGSEISGTDRQSESVAVINGPITHLLLCLTAKKFNDFPRARACVCKGRKRVPREFASGLLSRRGRKASSPLTASSSRILGQPDRSKIPDVPSGAYSQRVDVTARMLTRMRVRLIFAIGGVLKIPIRIRDASFSADTGCPDQRSGPRAYWPLKCSCAPMWIAFLTSTNRG